MGSERSAPQELQAHMSDMLPQVNLARHGETAWSLSGQATGRTDIPFAHRGERDAQELAKQLQGLSFVQVLTSPLQRARRTAVLAGFDECAQPDPDPQNGTTARTKAVARRRYRSSDLAGVCSRRGARTGKRCKR